jgi:hypothetical protein
VVKTLLDMPQTFLRDGFVGLWLTQYALSRGGLDALERHLARTE